ncbi:MAG: copper amine oxidase N-terminal domain-containing protein [Firmicutes bacterium]|nr:copper amine oxidase N-terminal domain-containing protein [Bacillota bacterium]
MDKFVARSGKLLGLIMFLSLFFTPVQAFGGSFGEVFFDNGVENVFRSANNQVDDYLEEPVEKAESGEVYEVDPPNERADEVYEVDPPDGRADENVEPFEEQNVWSENMATYEELDTRREGIELVGRIPTLTEYAQPIADIVNAKIDQIITEKIAEARDVRARLVTFDYELFVSQPYASIILISTVTTTVPKTDITSINFDINTGRMVTAEDIVGNHVVQLANRLLLETIRRDPENYNPNFDGMANNQPFSLTNNDIVFWLNDFQLATNSTFMLSLRLNDIKEYILQRDNFHIREDSFNVKMIPLRTVGQLGYEYSWNAATNSTSIFYNGELVIEVMPGVNNYVRAERFSRSLEVAPEVLFTQDYTTYVPLSFFDQILSLVAFSVDDNNNIVFASYPVTDAWFER